MGDLAGTGGVVVQAVHQGWSGDRERQVYEDLLGKGQVDELDPVIDRIKACLTSPVTTPLRQEPMDDRERCRSPHVQESCSRA